MSEKRFSTDELVNIFNNHSVDRPYYFGLDVVNTIIARLRAADKYEQWFKVESEWAGAVFDKLEKADKLCEEAKFPRVGRYLELRKAIADYEGSKED